MIRNLLKTFLLLALAGLAYYALTPMASLDARDVEIPPGSSLRAAAAALHRQSALDHPYAFVLLGRLLGKAGQVKAGSYQIEAGLTPYALLRKITSGEIRLSAMTFIEGWSFRQLRQALDAHAQLRHDTAGLSDADILLRLGVPERHPEGLFFPDTYYFDAGSSDLDVLRRAYQAMSLRLARLWPERQPGLPYADPYQALIMASIVEKETGASEERPLIAAVFLNRLRIGMRLQTDPTVIYGLGDGFDGNLRKRDLLADTPYNSYTRAGLPPTPIAMPGEAAIQAALHPAESRALYFVAKGGGRHHFSSSLDEHNRAVNRYQRGR